MFLLRSNGEPDTYLGSGLKEPQIYLLPDIQYDFKQLMSLDIMKQVESSAVHYGSALS